MYCQAVSPVTELPNTPAVIAPRNNPLSHIPMSSAARDLPLPERTTYRWAELVRESSGTGNGNGKHNITQAEFDMLRLMVDLKKFGFGITRIKRMMPTLLENFERMAGQKCGWFQVEPSGRNEERETEQAIST